MVRINVYRTSGKPFLGFGEGIVPALPLGKLEKLLSWISLTELMEILPVAIVSAQASEVHDD